MKNRTIRGSNLTSCAGDFALALLESFHASLMQVPEDAS